MMRVTIAKLGMVGFLLGVGVCEGQAGMLREWMQQREQARIASATAESKTIRDVAYGSDQKQRLDVYLPASAQGAPVIVMVHGGAWKIGDKRMDRVVENKVARWVPKGAIFVSINYRLLPAADPLKQADDVAAALAYVQTHAMQWGGDPGKIVLMGHSAGAHLVDLISSDPERYPALRPWRGTVSLDSAAMDIPSIMATTHYGFYDEAFGTDPAYWASASPSERLNRAAVPMLLVCSTQRPDKPCGQADAFAQKAAAIGVRTEVTPQPMSHKDINEELGLENDYTRRVEAFVRSLGIVL